MTENSSPSPGAAGEASAKNLSTGRGEGGCFYTHHKSSTNRIHPVGNRRAHVAGYVRIGFDVFGDVAGRSAQQIRRDQDLPVAIAPGTNADHWNRKCLGQF